MHNLENIGSKSVLWKFVGSVLGRSRQARDVINQKFRILIGDDCDIDFWNDD